MQSKTKENPPLEFNFSIRQEAQSLQRPPPDPARWQERRHGIEAPAMEAFGDNFAVNGFAETPVARVQDQCDVRIPILPLEAAPAGEYPVNEESQRPVSMFGP